MPRVALVTGGTRGIGAAICKALKAAGCKRVFEETASGGRWDRPELHRMLDHLRENDTVVVWKLDRLSRSLKDVLHIMERITNARAGFRSITENIDTTSSAGRMMMQMVGAFAEFERAMIRERVLAGLARAKEQGTRLGRRRIEDADAAKAVAIRAAPGSGKGIRRIAFKVGVGTVLRLKAG